MLKAYGGGGALVSLDVLRDPGLATQALWFDLEAPSPEELAFVTRETGLALPKAADIVEIESSSRLSSDGDVLTLTMPLVSRTSEGLQAGACGFVVSPRWLVTIRLAPSLAFTRFAEAAHLVHHVEAASVFVALLEAVVDRLADALEHLRDELDQLSHEIFHHRFAGAKGDATIRGRKTEAALQATLLTLGRDYEAITFLRDSQLGVGRIAGYAQGAGEWLPGPVVARLGTLEKDVASLNEYSTHLTDKVQFLLDTTMGLINISQNSLIKLLTLVSIVGIPPTLIAGIYGMNFHDIPELGWRYGYGYAWTIMIVSAVLPLGIFRKKGWV
ncbi:MAG: CorA family divalent cation transporter [Acidocella sp.]|nr:CorA family divalent cation transporter [Acidocella sp.]